MRNLLIHGHGISRPSIVNKDAKNVGEQAAAFSPMQRIAPLLLARFTDRAASSCESIFFLRNWENGGKTLPFLVQSIENTLKHA